MFIFSLFNAFETKVERTKFLSLSAVLSLVLGAYWLLRPLKDSVFLTMVGAAHLGKAKIVSVCVIIPIVILITKLVDIFPRHRILSYASLIYGVFSLIFSWFIIHPVFGIENAVESPYRILGWTFYIFVETIGIVLVSLFWSFVSDITSPESAKRGYPLIVLIAQFHEVLFLLLAQQIMYKSTSGIVVFCSSIVFFIIPLIISYFVKNTPKSQLEGFKGIVVNPIEGKLPKPTFYEGIQLIFNRPYLLGIFAIVMFQEIIVTIFDFQLKGLAKASFGGGDALSVFVIKYALFANVIAFFCMFFGAGQLSNYMGLKKTLLIMPVCIGFGSLMIGSLHSINTIFWILVFLKGMHYSFNIPAKEQLYIPTSKDSKYKAKSWIDMFGSRVAKSFGAGIHDFLKFMGPEIFISGSLFFTMGSVGLWIMAALFLGKTHAQAIKENRIVC